jgi:hypothetical protein
MPERRRFQGMSFLLDKGVRHLLVNPCVRMSASTFGSGRAGRSIGILPA